MKSKLFPGAFWGSAFFSNILWNIGAVSFAMSAGMLFSLMTLMFVVLPFSVLSFAVWLVMGVVPAAWVLLYRFIGYKKWMRIFFYFWYFALIALVINLLAVIIL